MLTAEAATAERGESYWSQKLRELAAARHSQPSDYRPAALRDMEQRIRAWERQVLVPALRWMPARKERFETPSGIKLKPVYTPRDLRGDGYREQLGLPGEYPFTRGVHPTMYRSRLWTMRMFSGYGTPEDTNRRLKYLLEHGETGLSIAFDMPTLYGYDCDHPRAEGEVGRCGVNVSSLRDMEIIFDGIPLADVSTSMTINAPAPVLTAMYAVVAERQGVPWDHLRGTVQADILKEYIAQKEWAFPPEAHLRLIRDMMVFCTEQMPQWNYLSVSGYHIREAGSSALQELAFTLADGFGYVDLGISAGLAVDAFAPRLSFFFNADMHFFEEIAKFRAARRIWATVLREKYRARNPRSLWLKFHTQTSGVSLTWQQPLNNVIRTAIEALAAVLGGSQSLHTNSYDEAYALPTEDAVTLALRTQQIIADETGVADVIDPLGGAYFVEWLTDEMEEGAYHYFEKIERIGGILAAIKTGYLQREIADTAYRLQQLAEKGERVTVGVNKYQIREDVPVTTLKISQRAQRRQRQRILRVRQQRDDQVVRRALEDLRQAFQGPKANTMYPLIRAVKAYATLGEIMDVGREVFGSWTEPSVL